MKIFRDRLRQAINEVCQAEGISQEALGERMGYGRTTFRNYFTRSQNMPVDVTRHIADELKLDLNWLFGRDVTPEFPKNDPMDELNQKMDKLLDKS